MAAAGEATKQDRGGCTDVSAPSPKDESNHQAPTSELDAGKTYRVAVETNCGTFTITLDTKASPKTTASFVSLADDGYFDDTTFHRIVPGFVIQGGDPTGKGTGGPGYTTVEPPPPEHGVRPLRGGDGEGGVRAAGRRREPVLRRHGTGRAASGGVRPAREGDGWAGCRRPDREAGRSEHRGADARGRDPEDVGRAHAPDHRRRPRRRRRHPVRFSQTAAAAGARAATRPRQRGRRRARGHRRLPGRDGSADGQVLRVGARPRRVAALRARGA